MADDSQQQSTSNPGGTNSNSSTLPVVSQEKICVEKLASISNVESLDVGTELADSQTDAAVPADDDCNSCGDSDGPPTPSSADWKPISPSVTFVQEMLDEGVNPREILRQLLPNTELPPDLPNSIMLHVIAQLLSEPPKREKLPQYNTLDDVVDLLRRSTNILVLTGAGVSVSCGIPDFRSKDGIYARLHSDFPDLPDPQAMFDIDYFRKNPRPFFDFAQEIYPGQFRPSPSHRFIKSLEDAGKLLRNYTQNIDTLEQVAGISNIVQCHGSFANASCCVCKHQVSCDDIREDIFAKRVPHCLKCPPEDIKAVMKPDIVFFGEDLPSQFHQQITADKDKVDLLIVIGSSLKVRPVALIPSSIPPEVPQVLINREPLSHCTMDVELLGNCDDIISELCLRLGGDEWTKVPPAGTSLLQRLDSLDLDADVVAAVPSSSSTDPCDEPEAKRAKTDDSVKENVASAEGSVASAEGSVASAEEDVSKAVEEVPTDELSEPLWSPRYVNVADRLPEKSYLFIPPNRTVFRGVELYYDRDSKTFTTEVGRHHSHSSSDSSGSVDGSEDSDDHRFDRETRSEGDAYPSSSSDDDDDSDGEETPLKRPSSCPPFHVLLD